MAGVLVLALVILVKFAYTIVGMIWVTVLGKIWDTVKEKFWDTVLGDICNTVLGKIGDYVVAPICQLLSYMCFFNSNIKELETQLEELRRVQQLVDDERRQLRSIGPRVEAWRKLANEVTIEVEGIIQGKPKVKEGCLNGWCPNLKLRYSLSRKAVEKTKDVVDLQTLGASYTKPSYSPPPTCTKTIPNKNFTAFNSRRLNMEEIVNALTNDKINLIGICGLPGVGKTTMAKEVAKRAKEDGLFVEVASACVGQKPNITNVQACIADMLGLEHFGDRASPEVRADLLRERLLQDNKKILVILDDIWEEIDLEDMGIPLGGVNKNLKMLYTSRKRYRWHDLQTKKEIPLDLLSEDEAWKLFREKAGDSADAQDLQHIAKQIVNKCGRLPLALVLIGSALSKTIGRIAIKDIWEGMLDRLTSASSTPANEHLSSRLELSYEYLEDKEAKRLFLLCCLFKEDEDIRIEDLARYGLGLSLFGGINEMKKVRRRVLLIVDDLKTRYLLLDSERRKKECVKVHDVVRDMGISIASKDSYALVSHGAASDWPKKGTYEHYAAISVISRTITELPEGLACPNVQLLMLQCGKLEKPPCKFFERMGKLKVFELNRFYGILKLQSLTNLETLSLECYRGDVLHNVSGFGALVNLEILSFRNSSIQELPEELGELVNLRLLDLQNTWSLKRIPSGVISRLVHLEELYVMESKFQDWEGEGKEEERRNANLREFESLSNLITLELIIRADVLLPKVPIFSKLKIHKVAIADDKYESGDGSGDDIDRYVAGNIAKLTKECKMVLMAEASIPIPSDRGGIDSLLRRSDGLFLHGEGCNNLVQELLRNGVDVLQQLKFLTISRCDKPECLVNIMNPVHLPPAPAVFPILQLLDLDRLANLREICCGPVPALSFGELHAFRVRNCGRLGNLFQLSIVGCLTKLERLIIRSCGMMEEVFIWKEQRGDVHVATNNRIEFPKLKLLILDKLQSLLGFCRGIDQIDFPELDNVDLRDLGQLNRLFHNNSNLSSNSGQDDDVGFHYLFPQKVSLPNLKVLKLADCNGLRYVFSPNMTKSIPQLRELHILRCEMLSRIVAEENGPGESTVDDVEFPQLEWVELRDLPNLVSFFPNVNTSSLAKSTEHYHNPLQRQPLFNEKVAIPSLEHLELSGLENVSDLWSSELSTGSFSKLKKLEVRCCPSLRNMFHHSMAGDLLNLQNLFISDCLTLEAVVGKEERVGGHGRKIEKTLFPELGKLQLGSLPKLRRFSHFTHPLEIPLLSEVDILDCPSMDAFSLEPVSAPKLSLPGTSWKGDLNNAIPLLQEVSLPNLKVLKLAKLENLERLGDDQLSVGSLSQLKEISVRDCGKLLCVIPSQLLSMLRDLENLKVECCNLLEEIFELEGVDYNEPNPEILPPLKLVKLSNLPKLNYISKRDPMGFKYIQALDIDNCNRLRYVFSPTMTKSIPQLCELRISRCEILSRIIAEENELGESTVDVVEFPRLECVGLYDLPNLVSFFPNVNTTSLVKSIDHYHNPLQPQTLFNEKVAIPSLEHLELSGLENVSDLWSSELPTGSFSKLKKLEVRCCASLRNMFHHSMAGDLLNLQNLFISDYSTLEAVVGKEERVGGHGRKIEKTLFPELGKLQLGSLANLRRFCHFTHPLEIPLLSKVDILDCPNMDAFSLEPVSAPKLSLPGTSWKGDLNNAIPILHERDNNRKEGENQRKEEEKEKEDEDVDEEEKEKVDENEEEEDQDEKRKEEEETTEKGRKRKWTDLDEDGKIKRL